MDFVVQRNRDIIPIEVKSERNVKARSLAEYLKKHEPKYSVKTSMKSEIKIEGVIRVPLYLIAGLSSFSQD